MAKNLRPTKRKAFNFLRSYFDVLNELKEDKDKLNFLLSVINKQFLDEDPKGLNFTVNLCYESQRHAVESSVKGWKRVNGCNPTTNPPLDPTTNPQEGEEEVKEEEEEELFVRPSFLDFWNKYDKKIGRPKAESLFNKLDQSEREKIMNHLTGYVKTEKRFRKDPERYLKNRSWEDELIDSSFENNLGHRPSLPNFI